MSVYLLVSEHFSRAFVSCCVHCCGSLMGDNKSGQELRMERPSLVRLTYCRPKTLTPARRATPFYSVDVSARNH